jgi:hypothetical protein
MHVIALLTQVTLLSSLMSSMPSIGYHTWMVGWAVDMMMLTAFMLMECIVAAYAKHTIAAARVAASKKEDDDSAALDAEIGAFPATCASPTPSLSQLLGSFRCWC